MTDNLVIALNSLPKGLSDFNWHLDKAFFEQFEDIISADVKVACQLNKLSDKIELDLDVKGKLLLPCDRCLEDLTIDVSEEIVVDVLFSDEVETSSKSEDVDELILLPKDAMELDLRQLLYDYICLSIPMKRVHSNNECNKEVLKKLEHKEELKDLSDSPFARLKELLNKE